jgi:hypothetical protein
LQIVWESPSDSMQEHGDRSKIHVEPAQSGRLQHQARNACHCSFWARGRGVGRDNALSRRHARSLPVTYHDWGDPTRPQCCILRACPVMHRGREWWFVEVLFPPGTSKKETASNHGSCGTVPPRSCRSRRWQDLELVDGQAPQAGLGQQQPRETPFSIAARSPPSPPPLPSSSSMPGSEKSSSRPGVIVLCLRLRCWPPSSPTPKKNKSRASYPPWPMRRKNPPAAGPDHSTGEARRSPGLEAWIMRPF